MERLRKRSACSTAGLLASVLASAPIDMGQWLGVGHPLEAHMSGALCRQQGSISMVYIMVCLVAVQMRA